MSKPETLFEQASFELNKFRERRMVERRMVARDTPDRRRQSGMPPEGTTRANDDGNAGNKQLN